MQVRDRGSHGQEGTILLPVILLMLLLATAATAMTLQARTSLREASTRRARLTLSLAADAAVRAVALALSSATADRASPPFAIDGSPQGCRLWGDRHLDLAVQDEGGRLDLNKATPDLLLRVLSRAGLSGSDAKRLAEAIVARREPATAEAGRSRSAGRAAKTAVAPKVGFASADELDDLPGLQRPGLYDRLRPLFTVANGSTGIDPIVAAPAIRAAIPPKELASLDLESLTTPSNHSDFTITATVGIMGGPRFRRQTVLHLDPQSGPPGRYTTWEAPDAFDAPTTETGEFCNRVAAALSADPP